jgi:predicted O-methyltransferase YrrM
VSDGYRSRAARVMLRHPLQGVERVRGRVDRRGDRRRLAALRVPLGEFYQVSKDWPERLHIALGRPWPCEETPLFEQAWAEILADLKSAGLRVGIRSYGGWNDGDQAFAQAIWCLIAHGQPGRVIETGVAHGLTSRVILTGLARNGKGHLWSVDLPAVDSALHAQIGSAVTDELRPRWTYVEGTSRERLPELLGKHGPIDLFVHDSLHTGRNQRFELESAWAALGAGGTAVVDDIDHSLAFREFVDHERPREWVAAEHLTGPGLAGSAGLWGLAVKNGGGGAEGGGGGGGAEGGGGGGGGAALGAGANPHYLKLAGEIAGSSLRGRRHAEIELAVVRELAGLIGELAPGADRLLQIQPLTGQDTLFFRDQLTAPVRPVIYGDHDERDQEAESETDFLDTELELARFSAEDGQFPLVVLNRELVTLKNAVPVLREVRRVLRPGGLLLLSTPNLAALHNRVLLLAGRQPTTLHLGDGDHVRGFTSASMSGLLERDLGFRLERVVGVGLAPVTGARLPRYLTGVAHTVIWAARRPAAGPKTMA